MLKKLDCFDIDAFRKIEYKISKNMPITNEELDYFLGYVVYITRSKIFSGSEYFENKCDLAQSIICHYFNDIGVINHPNMTINSITDYIIGHSFVVATFNILGNMTNYLIDPTYIQFFKKENCNINRYIGINGFFVRTPDPGYYIKEEDRSFINEFNYYGFGELTDRLAKVYGDSFYNTMTMVDNMDFKEISGFVYINSFLKGKEKLSIAKAELIDNGYYLDFNSENERKVK